ncbi:MAG TPA: SgcJ/EcaC family oxidoreductase [Noviherbaspirillum sp.]|nr:SgcJ/EcaC family oxidoreductase [Noviherbaspirillum sp.]
MEAMQEKEFRSIVKQTERFQDDANAFCSLLTEDAILVNAVGRRVVGRNAIRETMEVALATPLADVRTKHEFTGGRILSVDVAVVSMTKSVAAPPDAHVSTGSKVESTLVLRRHGAEWKIAVAHNTLVRAPAAEGP